jgi:nucleoside-diphosphate-sugar epimerase
MRKILVTGASGFIGRHVLAPLLQAGHEVHAVSFKKKPKKETNIKWHQADLKNSTQTQNLIEKIQPTHLLHFAWCAEPGKFWTDPENIQWVEASYNLIKFFHAQGGIRAVVAGSCAEYNWNKSIYSEKARPEKPATLYGKCKQELQIKIESFCNEVNLSLCWGRVFFVYGPYEHPARVVSSVVRSLLNNEFAKCSNGKQKRDLLFVEDVASGFVSILENKITGIVNIGSGEGIALKDVIKTIGDKIGRSNLIQMGTLLSPANDPLTLVADTKRLTEEVGWVPKFDINTGLDRTIQWWKNTL